MLGMALTGEVLRFDQESYWDLGYRIHSGRTHAIDWRAPVHFLMGGPIIAGATLARMYHRCMCCCSLARSSRLTGLHLLLAYRLGISEWPMPGRIVRRETYIANYREGLRARGRAAVPEWPSQRSDLRCVHHRWH